MASAIKNNRAQSHPWVVFCHEKQTTTRRKKTLPPASQLLSSSWTKRCRGCFTFSAGLLARRSAVFADSLCSDYGSASYPLAWLCPLLPHHATDQWQVWYSAHTHTLIMAAACRENRKCLSLVTKHHRQHLKYPWKDYKWEVMLQQCYWSNGDMSALACSRRWSKVTD